MCATDGPAVRRVASVVSGIQGAAGLRPTQLSSIRASSSCECVRIVLSSIAREMTGGREWSGRLRKGCASHGKVLHLQQAPEHGLQRQQLDAPHQAHMEAEPAACARDRRRLAEADPGLHVLHQSGKSAQGRSRLSSAGNADFSAAGERSPAVWRACSLPISAPLSPVSGTFASALTPPGHRSIIAQRLAHTQPAGRPGAGPHGWGSARDE